MKTLKFIFWLICILLSSWSVGQLWGRGEYFGACGWVCATAWLILSWFTGRLLDAFAKTSQDAIDLATRLQGINEIYQREISKLKERLAEKEQTNKGR